MHVYVFIYIYTYLKALSINFITITFTTFICQIFSGFMSCLLVIKLEYDMLSKFVSYLLNLAALPHLLGTKFVWWHYTFIKNPYWIYVRFQICILNFDVRRKLRWLAQVSYNFARARLMSKKLLKQVKERETGRSSPDWARKNLMFSYNIL